MYEGKLVFEIVINNKKGVIEHFWTIFLGGMILLSVFGGVFSREILNSSGLGYYINYFLWISLGIVYVIKERMKLFGKEYIIIWGLILLNSIVGTIFGEVVLGLRANNFHQGVIIGLVILMVMGVNWNEHLGKEDIIFLMNIIFGIGIVASLYAMIIQNQNWIGVLSGRERMNNAWVYRSFFGQRNVFAYFCFLSVVAGIYLLEITKKKRYLGGVLLLALQIYITDSRTAMLTCFLFVIMCTYLNLGNKEKIIVPVLGICFIVCIAFFVDVSALIGRFYHETNTSFGDSGSLRINMWYSGIQYLFSNGAVLNGFGFDSQGPYLEPLFRLQSFHNAYVDILFQGGIVLLGIHLYMIAKTTKSVLRLESRGYKYISISFITAFLFGCLFDSSAMLFSSNYEAVLSTLMICVLTRVKI